MDSHVQREDLAQTVPKNANVTTMPYVVHPLDSVSAAPDTWENGKRHLSFQEQTKKGSEVLWAMICNCV